jgi:hypothetical protein
MGGPFDGVYNQRLRSLNIPLWANVLWSCCVAAMFALIAYKAAVLHLDFVQILGLLWLDLGMIMLWLIGTGAAIYGLVCLARYRRGPMKAPEPKVDDSDVANLVP